MDRRLAYLPVLLSVLAACVSEAQQLPPHVALEVYPGLIPTLAEGADYPIQVVDYDGGPVPADLPPKSRWGAGEYGHLRRLKLRLTKPDDVQLTFAMGQDEAGHAVPRADLQLRLCGPANAEWWQKLPAVQGDWGRVGSFGAPIALTVRARAMIRVAAPRGELPYVWLDFEKVRDADVKLNVKGCPPWLDQLIESQADVSDHVDEHIRANLAPLTRVTLPALVVPISGKPVTYRDIRPTVKDGVLRVEFSVAGG